MAENDRHFCSKYGIKRPVYNQEDLHQLEALVTNELPEYPSWRMDWVNESVLIRFLKAHIHVTVAYEKILAYCKWREEFKVDIILEGDDEIIREESRGRSMIVNSIRDYCGRPIMLVFARKHDKNHGSYESLFKFVIYQLEELCKQADENEFKSFDLVFDLNGFSMRNMDFQYVQTFLQYLKEYYPERLGVAFIINYALIFYGCWKIIKLWLNDVIRSKILFADEALLNDFMDTKQLPVQLFH